MLHNRITYKFQIACIIIFSELDFHEYRVDPFPTPSLHGPSGFGSICRKREIPEDNRPKEPVV